MANLVLRVIDIAEWPFAVPHDWRIIEWLVRLITPKSIWAYYGNPLCWAYSQSVAHWFYRLYDWVGRRLITDG